MAEFRERAVVFQGRDEALLGIVHPAEAPSDGDGVLLVVGGPQYRVGSHRQFVLLARHLAAHGIDTMRFDYQGMGDSLGELVNFEDVDGDIHAAVDTLESQCQVPGVVLWGLCDAASAALFYAAKDSRVHGLVLLNPWVRTEEGIARAYVQHYYRARFLQWETWRRVLSGEINLLKSLQSLLGQWRKSRGHGAVGDKEERQSLPERMASGFENFQGPVLIILSGDDLTAQEFEDMVRQSPRWQRLLDAPRVTIQRIPSANHTFSRQEWRDQVAQWTSNWMTTQPTMGENP